MKLAMVLKSFIVTSAAIIVTTSIGHSEETNKGFVCSENHALGGGGISGIKLELAENNRYKMTYVSAHMDGTGSKETLLGTNMECKFSKLDPFIAFCISDEVNEKKQSNYLKATRNKMTVVNPYGEGVYESYNFTIAAPSVSDEVLSSIDVLNFKPKQKSIEISIKINNAISSCKSL